MKDHELDTTRPFVIHRRLKCLDCGKFPLAGRMRHSCIGGWHNKDNYRMYYLLQYTDN